MRRVLWTIGFAAVCFSLLGLATFFVFGRDATLFGLKLYQVNGLAVPVGIFCIIAINLLDKRRQRK